MKDVVACGQSMVLGTGPGFGFTQFIQDSKKSGMTAFDRHDA